MKPPRIFAEAAAVDAELCLPSICIQEALATVSVRRKSTDAFGKSLQQKVEELRDDRSVTAIKLKVLISDALIENGRLRDEREARLKEVLLSLAPVRLVELDHAMTAMAISAPLVYIVETLGISNAHKSRPRFRLRTFNTSRALMIPLHGSRAKVV
jgi:hypothetical protein